MHSLRVLHLNWAGLDLFYTDSEAVICAFRQVINLRKEEKESNRQRVQSLKFYSDTFLTGKLVFFPSQNQWTSLTKDSKKSEVLTS